MRVVAISLIGVSLVAVSGIQRTRNYSSVVPVGASSLQVRLYYGAQRQSHVGPVTVTAPQTLRKLTHDLDTYHTPAEFMCATSKQGYRLAFRFQGGRTIRVLVACGLAFRPHAYWRVAPVTIKMPFVYTLAHVMRRFTHSAHLCRQRWQHQTLHLCRRDI